MFKTYKYVKNHWSYDNYIYCKNYFEAHNPIHLLLEGDDMNLVLIRQS